MELKHIKELMAAMGRTGTKRLMIKENGFELQLEREENGSYRSVDSLEMNEENPLKNNIALHRANMALSRGSGEMAGRTTPPLSSDAGKEDISSVYVSSPMVGTFYAAPSPDDPPFVKVGDKIDKNTVVCIIEAMKVMNEVKAGVTGTIAEILVESGHPVEFGSKLYRIS